MFISMKTTNTDIGTSNGGRSAGESVKSSVGGVGEAETASEALVAEIEAREGEKGKKVRIGRNGGPDGI